MINVVAVGILIVLCAIYMIALVIVYRLIRKKSIKIARITAVALPLLTFITGYTVWHSGTVYGDREYDECGQYYFQRYATIGPSAFQIGMPGGGSDSIDGFIRLYNSKGDLLNEYFTGYLMGIKPTWLDDSLWLMGTSDEISWPLQYESKKKENKAEMATPRNPSD